MNSSVCARTSSVNPTRALCKCPFPEPRRETPSFSGEFRAHIGSDYTTHEASATPAPACTDDAFRPRSLSSTACVRPLISLSCAGTGARSLPFSIDTTARVTAPFAPSSTNRKRGNEADAAITTPNHGMALE